MELINSFKKYLVAIIPNIVYKSVKQAEEYETRESRFNGDLYIEAMLKSDSLMTYQSSSIPTSVLNKVGIYDNQQIRAIQEDKFLIPKNLQNRVVELMREYVINNYEEKNDYYRMLNGLPSLDDDFIYLNPSELNSFGYYEDSMEDYENDVLDNLTPIHELPENVLLAMESSGYLDEVYQEYVDDSEFNAKYIKHLGRKKISILQARMATQYELLYVPKVDNASRFSRDFSIYYEEARQYFLNQIYNYHFSAEYDFYEGYIGFFILNMSIQRVINSMFEVVVQRDFYDIETCRMFLEAYGVPFISSFTFNQQLTLVKNLNILLMEKCTTRVLFDLLSLLEFDKYDLTKYVLVKQHKTTQSGEDSEPVPIFVYRTVLTETGEPIYVLDKGEMYDYYFVGIPMDENETNLVEFTDSNAFDYEQVVMNDDLWIEDDELIQKLQDDEFNYVETKYTNISITIKMYDMMFEHIYLQKMICDKGSETSNIEVNIPLIIDSPINLLEMEVLLICLLAKHNKMEPTLFTSPSKELAVLGFNFDADLELIKEEVLNNPKIYSEKLANFIKNISFNSVSDVNDMYYNVKSLSDLLKEGMETTHSEQVYHAYKKLYQALMVTDVHNEIFVLPDGSIPDTYMDWLKVKNYPLYEAVSKLTVEESVDKINYITTKMIGWFTNAKYLAHLNPIDLTVINNVIKMLRWFKSYTMDIRELDVIYLFDSKYYNLMKMLGRLWLSASGVIRETDIGYHEWISSMSKTIRNDETRNKLLEVIRMSKSITLKDFNELMRDAIRIVAQFKLGDNMSVSYADAIIMTAHELLKGERMNMHDTIRIIHPD